MGSTEIRLTKEDVKINNIRAALPSRMVNGVSVSEKFGLVTVEWEHCGVTVRFDGHESMVFVEVEPQIGIQVQGICGNCNGRQDDRVLKGGDEPDVESKSIGDKLIGDSWVVHDNEAPDANTCGSVAATETCEEDMKSKVHGGTYCGYFSDELGPFGECFGKLDSELHSVMKETCVEDICLTNGSRWAVCSNLAALAEECREIGVTGIEWRRANFCPLIECPANSRYSHRAPSCQPTCTYAPIICSVPAHEGCMCDPGYVWKGKECVKEELCGCIDDLGELRNVGELWLSEDCNTRYTCTGGKDGLTEIDSAVVMCQGVCVSHHGHRQCEMTDTDVFESIAEEPDEQK